MGTGTGAALAPAWKLTTTESPVKSTPPEAAVPLPRRTVAAVACAQQPVRVKEGATTAVPASFTRKVALWKNTSPGPEQPVTGQVRVSHAAPV